MVIGRWCGKYKVKSRMSRVAGIQPARGAGYRIGVLPRRSEMMVGFASVVGRALDAGQGVGLPA